jgi:hypothetical protein
MFVSKFDLEFLQIGQQGYGILLLVLVCFWVAGFYMGLFGVLEDI